MKLTNLFVLIVVTNLAVGCGSHESNSIDTIEAVQNALSSLNSLAAKVLSAEKQRLAVENDYIDEKYTYETFYDYKRECMDSTKVLVYRGRIVNDREEGFWIKEYNDSLHYKGGLLHGLCIEHEIDYSNYSNKKRRFVANYVEGKKQGEVNSYYEDGAHKKENYENDRREGESYTYYKDGTRTTVTYINDCREGDELTYDKQGHVVNVTRYKNDEVRPFMDDYYCARKYYNEGEKIFFFCQGEFEYASYRPVNNQAFRMLNADNRFGAWIKFRNTIPVGYICFDKSGQVEYSQELSEDDYIKGNYKRYRDGVLIESGWAEAEVKRFEDMSLKEQVAVGAVTVGVVALGVALIRGGGSLNVGGGDSDVEEELTYRMPWLMLNGPITYYNANGPINRIERYVDGKLAK